ncbi:phosphopantetheine-binding protein [Streptomyces sp. 12257]|uniref:phosphopantetheine-binding protein n=1 Tax=Streptomyces sp. 12257 TaxID=3041009 RepID=UPI0024A7DD70|nr:phosphopantetheine-binding protein [Streptomyces sp. 12257]MDI5903940.1 phosphopantetheine-binding protein [Streptomyces sp. 12257]
MSALENAESTNASTATHASMETVLDFLRKLNASVDTIAWDRDLIEARILDSLAFVEFLLLIEELTGEPVDLATTDVNNFRTLERINALLTEAGHAHV